MIPRSQILYILSVYKAIYIHTFPGSLHLLYLWYHEYIWPGDIGICWSNQQQIKWFMPDELLANNHALLQNQKTPTTWWSTAIQVLKTISRIMTTQAHRMSFRPSSLMMTSRWSRGQPSVCTWLIPTTSSCRTRNTRQSTTGNDDETEAWISNRIPYFTVGCNYTSMS